MQQLLDKLANRCIPHRRFACFGSFCWAGAAVRKMTEFAARTKWEVIGRPVEMKQGFGPACYEACDELARQLAQSR